jgi:hypothetical protein
VVAHPKQRAVAVALHVHFDVDLIAGELHGVVEQVHDGAAKLLPVADDIHGRGVRGKPNGHLGQVTPRSREVHTLLREAEQVVPFEREGRATGLAGPEHLFDRLQEPLGVLEHDAVELAAPHVVNRALAGDERLEMQTDRRDRGLSSWVTALTNASCCSVRRISRTRKSC